MHTSRYRGCDLSLSSLLAIIIIIIIEGLSLLQSIPPTTADYLLYRYIMMLLLVGFFSSITSSTHHVFVLFSNFRMDSRAPLPLLYSATGPTRTRHPNQSQETRECRCKTSGVSGNVLASPTNLYIIKIKNK